MEIGAFATAIASRELRKVQAEIGVKVFRLALDAKASSEAALLAANASDAVGQNVNQLA